MWSGRVGQTRPGSKIQYVITHEQVSYTALLNHSCAPEKAVSFIYTQMTSSAGITLNQQWLKETSLSETHLCKQADVLEPQQQCQVIYFAIQIDCCFDMTLELEVTIKIQFPIQTVFQYFTTVAWLYRGVCLEVQMIITKNKDSKNKEFGSFQSSVSSWPEWTAFLPRNISPWQCYQLCSAQFSPLHE